MDYIIDKTLKTNKCMMNCWPIYSRSATNILQLVKQVREELDITAERTLVTSTQQSSSSNRKNKDKDVDTLTLNIIR